MRLALSGARPPEGPSAALVSYRVPSTDLSDKTARRQVQRLLPPPTVLPAQTLGSPGLSKIGRHFVERRKQQLVATSIGHGGGGRGSEGAEPRRGGPGGHGGWDRRDIPGGRHRPERAAPHHRLRRPYPEDLRRRTRGLASRRLWASAIVPEGDAPRDERREALRVLRVPRWIVLHEGNRGTRRTSG